MHITNKNVGSVEKHVSQYRETILLDKRSALRLSSSISGAVRRVLSTYAG